MNVKIIVKKLLHREMECLGLFFPVNYQIQSQVKTLAGCKFSITHKCWYLPIRTGLIEEIVEKLRDIAELDLSALNDTSNKLTCSSPDAINQLLRLIQQKLKLKGYSPVTAKTYLTQFKLFVQFYGVDALPNITEAEIRSYLLYLIERRKLSKSTQNQAINAIKFFFEKVLGEERRVYHLERPMKDKRLPTILSEEEVVQILTSAKNIKHRLMLMLIYSAGLRRSELLNLRVGDIDFDRKMIFIRGGKGRKDRQTILAQSVVPLATGYFDRYKPKFWMFEGAGQKQYSATSLQNILKRAVSEAGIKKSVHLHTLRHSFATHLLENGTSTRYIQELLGHESSRTTELYTQVTQFAIGKIKSPLDSIASQKVLGHGEE